MVSVCVCFVVCFKFVLSFVSALSVWIHSACILKYSSISHSNCDLIVAKTNGSSLSYVEFQLNAVKIVCACVCLYVFKCVYLAACIWFILTWTFIKWVWNSHWSVNTLRVFFLLLILVHRTFRFLVKRLKRENFSECIKHIFPFVFRFC